MWVRFQGKEVGDRKYEGENRRTGTGRVKWLEMESMVKRENRKG